jgi:hypothetical protein
MAHIFGAASAQWPTGQSSHAMQRLLTRQSSLGGFLVIQLQRYLFCLIFFGVLSLHHQGWQQHGAAASRTNTLLGLLALQCCSSSACGQRRHHVHGNKINCLLGYMRAWF